MKTQQLCELYEIKLVSSDLYYNDENVRKRLTHYSIEFWEVFFSVQVVIGDIEFHNFN